MCNVDNNVEGLQLKINMQDKDAEDYYRVFCNENSDWAKYDSCPTYNPDTFYIKDEELMQLTIHISFLDNIKNRLCDRTGVHIVLVLDNSGSPIICAEREIPHSEEEINKAFANMIEEIEHKINMKI